MNLCLFYGIEPYSVELSPTGVLIRLKIQQSPDYAEEADFEKGYQDFRTRLDNYEKVYEPVDEGSYIKVIDMAKGQGGQIQGGPHNHTIGGLAVCLKYVHIFTWTDGQLKELCPIIVVAMTLGI
ncbi:uncharacterized protein LOC108222673 [Daucus carota subsp. sativus]|uniref:uncharacterized protein LOC108222673 n=1 Tax=Daucus carota subsp. sativus TaxID=79200 RepID=UPI003083190A